VFILRLQLQLGLSLLGLLLLLLCLITPQQRALSRACAPRQEHRCYARMAESVA